MTVQIACGGLQPVEVVEVARGGERVELTEAARRAMRKSRAWVEELAQAPEPVYGISTGFGALAATRVAPEQRSELQHALIRSHSAGMGPPVATEVVRAMMLLRLRSLARGYSGTRPAVAEGLAALLNAGVTPVVPTHGSLGASGDLAPLAHVGLCLVGEGEAIASDGQRLGAPEALGRAGLVPLRLE